LSAWKLSQDAVTSDPLGDGDCLFLVATGKSRLSFVDLLRQRRFRAGVGRRLRKDVLDLLDVDCRGIRHGLCDGFGGCDGGDVAEKSMALYFENGESNGG